MTNRTVGRVTALAVILTSGGLTSTSAAEQTGAPNPQCAMAPTSAGQWPAACYQPFEPRGVFDDKLPGRAVLARHSATAVSLPVTAKPGNLAVNSRGAGPGEPVYYATAGDPLYTLSCVHDPYGRGDHSCPIDTQRTGIRIPVPAGARPEGNQTTVVNSGVYRDAHLIVIDAAAGWEYDLWQVQSTTTFQQTETDGTVLQGLSPAGGTIDFAWGGRIRVNSDGTPAHQARGDGIDDSNAAHWAESAARVRAEELAAGSIQHALWLNITCTADTASVYPADPNGRGKICAGGLASPLGSHPLGTRFWLDLSPQQIANLPIPTWKKTILVALATFGGFVGDTNADPGKLFYVETEAGNQYSSLTGTPGSTYPDRWWTFALNNGWEPYQPPDGAPAELVGKLYAAAGDSFDWQGQVWPHLKVLDSCLTPEIGKPCT